MLPNNIYLRSCSALVSISVLVASIQVFAPSSAVYAQSVAPTPGCNLQTVTYKCPPPAQSQSGNAAGTQRSSASSAATTPTPTPSPSSTGGGISPWWLVGIGGALAVVAATHGGGGNSDANALERDGPRFVETYPVGSFAIRGFAKDGWPIVLDFKPEPNTRTTLDVVFNEHRTASILVDTNGLAGRHLDKFDMPANGWAKNKPKPADYVVRSIYLEPSPRAGQAAPVEVYGIGGGPRAVGSVAIEQLTFRAENHNPGAAVQFAYHAKSAFNHVSTEVVRFENDGEEIRLARVMQANEGDISVGTHAGSWDGRDAAGARSFGTHRFQVRGWFTSDDKSWVGAVAPTLLKVN